MRTLSFLYVHVLALFFFGCATDLPVKTARDTSIITGNPQQESISDSESIVTDSTDESTDPAPPTAVSTPTAPVSNAAKPKTDSANQEQTQRLEKIELSQIEIQKYAYELGFDPKKTLSEEQKKQISDRKRLRELERSLDTHKERLQYSKVLPWFKNDVEKIEMLNIPSIEGRQVWINKNKIWSRAKSLKEYDEVVESADIAMGMPAEYVKKSWGEPDNIETSGNPIYRNERWQYNKQVSTPQGYKNEKRLVYFEGGRVVGWETE